MFFGIDIDVIPDKTYNSITPEKLGTSPKNFPNYDLLRDVDTRYNREQYHIPSGDKTEYFL